MITLKDVLHTIADRVRHTDEAGRAALHRMIDELADDVEKGTDLIDPPTADDQAPTDPVTPPAL